MKYSKNDMGHLIFELVITICGKLMCGFWKKFIYVLLLIINFMFMLRFRSAFKVKMIYIFLCLSLCLRLGLGLSLGYFYLDSFSSCVVIRMHLKLLMHTNVGCWCSYQWTLQFPKLSRRLEMGNSLWKLNSFTFLSFLSLKQFKPCLVNLAIFFFFTIKPFNLFMPFCWVLLERMIGWGKSETKYWIFLEMMYTIKYILQLNGFNFTPVFKCILSVLLDFVMPKDPWRGSHWGSQQLICRTLCSLKGLESLTC